MKKHRKENRMVGIISICSMISGAMIGIGSDIVKLVGGINLLLIILMILGYYHFDDNKTDIQ